MGSADDRKELRHLIRDTGVKVVIVDPLYLSMGGTSVSASNLYEVGPVLAAFNETCRRAGATPVLIHHTTKPTSTKRTAVALGDLAFAGIGEFARQWLLVGRTAEYEPGTGAHDLLLSIGGSAGHSSGWSVRVDEGGGAENRRWSVQVRRTQGAATGGPSPEAERLGLRGRSVTMRALTGQKTAPEPVFGPFETFAEARIAVLNPVRRSKRGR